MTSLVVTMNPAATLQQIMGFRSHIGASRQECVMSMKKIEPLLNPAEVVSSNWRSGANFQQSGNNLKKNGQSSSMNTKWKNSANSHASTGAEASKNESSPHQKYESKFKNSEAPVEETILNTIILNKLNKFSASTYTEIRDFLYQILDSGESNFTKEFMQLVFKKAATEEIFCPLYAKLLSELRVTYPVIQSEMAELFHSYLVIFQDMKNLSELDYKTFVVKNSEKKYRMGYSQFLAELVILEAVDSKSLEETFLILIENVNRDGKEDSQKEEIQEYTDCLVRMSKVFHKKNTLFFIALRKNLMLKVEPLLVHIIQSPKEEYPGISAKARFALMDVCDNLKGV
jgi:hypothetical protein